MSRLTNEKLDEIKKYVCDELNKISSKRDEVMLKSPNGSRALKDYDEGKTEVLIEIVKLF